MHRASEETATGSMESPASPRNRKVVLKAIEMAQLRLYLVQRAKD
jgi:hypothetical protein